jgi:hypothetical protein
MKTTLKISPTQLPTRWPITSTAVILFALDRFHAAQIIWGIIITLLVIYWLVVLVAWWNEESVMLLEIKTKQGIRDSADNLKNK